MTFDALLDRVRGEYREMPDLRLTLPEAARLWHIDRVTCKALLEALVAEGFLCATRRDQFVMLPRPRQRGTHVIPSRTAAAVPFRRRA